jgi:transcription elongation GreA/GreB family factor
VKDPRVAVPGKKSEPYILREEPLKAEDEILEEFFEIKAPKKQIVLAEKLLELSLTHDEIKDQLPDVLNTLTTALEQTRLLNHGERLHGLWVRNDLARFIHEDFEKLSPTSASILEEVPVMSELAVQIPAGYYKRLLDLLQRVYPDQWEKITLDLLRGSSGRFTTECVNFLIEQSRADLVRERLKQWLNEQTMKGPLLYWVVRNRNSRKYTKLLHDLISPRLFKAIFYAIDYEALQNVATRRIPLADLLSSDEELIPELLAEATPETANDLAITLILNQGFEDLTKKSLLARFIRQFPNVQNIVAGNDEMQPDTSESLIVSRSSLDLIKEGYDDLVTRKIPENKQAIARARELGDLRENSEYIMARQDQDTLLARKSQLEQDIGRARVTDFADAPTDTVGIGSAVELEVGSTGSIVTYYILGAWDSDPEANILSYKTPLGQSLIAQRVGNTVSTVIDDSEETWTIRSISRWVEQ